MAEIPDYPGNANRNTYQISSEPKTIQPVISKPVKQINPRPTFLQAMFPMGDRNFGEFFLQDLLYPNLRRAASTILHGMVTRLFGGGGSSPTFDNRYVYSNVWSDDRYREYDRVYSSGMKRKELGSPKNSRPNLMRMDSFVFPDKEECEKVLAVLDELIDRTGWAPVSAFYEAINVSADRTFYNYGWNNLATAKVRPVDNGYVIEFPKPKPID